MTALLPATLIASLVFIVILALSAFAVRTGFIPDDAMRLWVGAMAAGDGEVPIGRIVSGYPSIPFLSTALLEWLTPARTPTPAVLAALLLGLLAGRWFVALRELGVAVATVATALIVFHPALVRAAIAGPAETFLVLFLFILGKGLYELRAQSTAPEVMTVALALVGLAFSHPMGAAIAAAAVPFLLLAVRPVLVANSALNVVVALIFPAVFCAFAFIYMSWVFPGSGWSFFTAPGASLAAWAAGFGGGLTGSLSLDAGIVAAVALALGAPAAVAVIYWVRRRRPLVAPALVLIAASLSAAVITVATGLFGDPAAVIVVAPVLCALVMIRIPVVRERIATVVALLVAGWFGGAIGLMLVDPRVATHLAEALEGGGGDRDRIDQLNLGAATLGHDGVLVDTSNAPAVVLGRGTARGLYVPRSETFALAMLFGRFDTPFVAVADPHSMAGAQDQMNKVFPQLYRSGSPGYRLVYQNPTWRLFARVDQRQVRKD